MFNLKVIALRMSSLFLAIVFLAACAEENNIPSNAVEKPEPCVFLEYSGRDMLRIQLAESLQAWEKFKLENESSYVYEVNGGGSFAMNNWVTTVGVFSDEVLYRGYREINRAGETVVAWLEHSDELASHDQGDEAQTMDAIYEFCSAEVLSSSPETHDVIFRLDGQGLLAACFKIEKGVMDGPGEGYTINSLRPHFQIH